MMLLPYEFSLLKFGSINLLHHPKYLRLTLAQLGLCYSDQLQTDDPPVPDFIPMPTLCSAMPRGMMLLSAPCPPMNNTMIVDEECCDDTDGFNAPMPCAAPMMSRLASGGAPPPPPPKAEPEPEVSVVSSLRD